MTEFATSRFIADGPLDVELVLIQTMGNIDHAVELRIGQSVWKAQGSSFGDAIVKAVQMVARAVARDPGWSNAWRRG